MFEKKRNLGSIKAENVKPKDEDIKTGEERHRFIYNSDDLDRQRKQKPRGTKRETPSDSNGTKADALKESDNRTRVTSWLVSKCFKKCARMGMLFGSLVILSQVSAAKTNEIGSTLTINTENSPANLRMDMDSWSLGYDGLKLPQSDLDPIADCLYKQFKVVYSQLQQRLAPDSHSQDIYLDFGEVNIARASHNKMHIRLNPEYFKNNPLEIEGVLTHELTHLVQKYPNQLVDVSHFTEGIADYARYKYGPKNDHWALPRLDPGHKYTDGYGVTARFLVWLEENKSDRIVDDLNRLLQKGKFSEDAFVQWIGQTVDDLWAEYSHNQFAKQDWEEFYKPVITRMLISALGGVILGTGLATATERILEARDQRRLSSSEEQVQQSQQPESQMQNQLKIKKNQESTENLNDQSSHPELEPANDAKKEIQEM